MHAEDLLVNDGRHWKAIETVCEGLPNFDVVSPLACEGDTVQNVSQNMMVYLRFNVRKTIKNVEQNGSF